MPLAGEDVGDLIVEHTGAREIKHAVAHFRTPREFDDGVDIHLHFEIGHSTATPYNPDRSQVVFTTVKDDLLDKAPQQRLALSIRGVFVLPYLRQASGQRDD